MTDSGFQEDRRPSGAKAADFGTARHTAEPEFRFVCPECGMRPVVNASVRTEMLVTGCFICRTSVSEGDFLEL